MRQHRELLGLMYMTVALQRTEGETQWVEHRGLGFKPAWIPHPLMGTSYPRELVEHLLDPYMWAKVLNLGIDASEGRFGMLEGFRIITTPRYINDELDCYRQYPAGRELFRASDIDRLSVCEPDSK